jgi:hypothetical protein
MNDVLNIWYLSWRMLFRNGGRQGLFFLLLILLHLDRRLRADVHSRQRHRRSMAGRRRFGLSKPLLRFSRSLRLARSRRRSNAR